MKKTGSVSGGVFIPPPAQTSPAPAPAPSSRSTAEEAGVRPLAKQEIEGAGQKISGRPTFPQAGLLTDPRLDWKFLREFGFDAARFQRDQQLIASGAKTEKNAIVRDPFSPLGELTAVVHSGENAQLMRALGES